MAANNDPRNTARLRESWVLFFLLGCVMLNYPFLHIFNKPATLFGIPILVLYFFIGWPISIGVIYLFSRVIEYPTNNNRDDDETESEPVEDDKA